MIVQDLYNPLELHELLRERFNLEETQDLCFHLSVDYDNLAGAGRNAKARELVEYFKRRNALAQLAEAMREARPDIVVASKPTAPLPQLADSVQKARPDIVVAANAEVEPQLVEGSQGKRPDVLVVAKPPEAQPEVVRYAHSLFMRISNSGSYAQALPQLPFVGKLLPEPEQATPMLLEMVKEMIERQGEGGRDLLYEMRGNDIVLATLGDPSQLLRFAIKVAQRREDQDFQLRMALHSEQVHTNAVGDGYLLNPCIDMTRRVADLGDDGHILASGQIADLLIQTDEFAPLFHAAGKCEVKHRIRMEVYNIYDAAIGNPAAPSPRAADRVLKDVSIPDEMRGTNTGQIKLNFWPDVSYITVKFEFDNENIQITCEGQEGKDCRFEFDFVHSHDSHEQTFEIGVKTIPSDSLELLRVFCYDEKGELATAPVRGWINLRRRADPPANFYEVIKLVLWLWDQFWGLRWQAKVSVLLLTLASAYLLFPAVTSPQQRNKLARFKEDTLIKVGFWPERIDKWIDEIRSTQEGTWEQASDWSYPEDKWRLVPGEVRGGDGALLIDGTGIGVHKQLQSKAFYDFNLEFKVEFRKGNKASWLLRANPGKQEWYLFELERRECQLYLKGFACSPSKDKIELDNNNDAIFFRDCKYDDRYRVRAKIDGYEFQYWIATFPASPVGERRTYFDINYPISGTVIRDARGRFRYGNLGLLGTDEGSQSVLYYWRVQPLTE
ncbi:MAG: hypothetical protein AABN34_05170 [Acidobacteriota bacterium]